MESILLLHDDPALRLRVKRMTGPYRVEPVSDWDALFRQYRGGGSRGVVILDPYHAQEPQPSDRLRLFLRDFPSALVLAALHVDPESASHICRLGEWGVAGVISMSTDTTGYKVESRIAEARERSAMHAILGLLPETLPTRARTILETGLATVVSGGGPAEFAAAMYLSLRTLQRRASRAGLPPPRRILAWMRLLVAARYLDDRGRTVMSAALAAGYNSDTTLHRAFRRLGMPSPTSARERSALQLGIEQFLKETSIGG